MFIIAVGLIVTDTILFYLNLSTFGSFIGWVFGICVILALIFTMSANNRTIGRRG
jgi:hypothetical protein